jgi:hypothetical protein
VRYQSTAKPHPRDKALNLINLAPGESLLQRTSFVTALAGLAAYAVSKEIYIIDAEFLEGLCMIGAFTVWYSAVKDTARDFFNDQKEVRCGFSYTFKEAFILTPRYFHTANPLDSDPGAGRPQGGGYGAH